MVVDNTAPSGTDVEAVNGGATVGKAEAGDVVSFTFSEPIEPASLLAGAISPADDRAPARHQGEEQLARPVRRRREPARS